MRPLFRAFLRAALIFTLLIILVVVFGLVMADLAIRRGGPL